MSESRNHHLDNVKFILILLVIFGHIVPRLGISRLGDAIGVSFYFFHMPLMVMISGYFTRKTDIKKFWNSIFHLLEAFLIFDVLLTIELWLSGNFHFSVKSLIIPRWSLWYLVSLIFWRTLIQFTPSLSLHPKLIIVISIVIGVLSGFVPIGEPFSFQRTFSYLPYFLVGYFVGKNKESSLSFDCIPLPIAALFLLSFPVITFFVDFPFELLLEGKTPYYVFDYTLWLLPLFRMVLYLVSIFASFCVLKLVPKKEIAWVTKQGQDTLLYYLYHTSFIYGVMFISNHLFHLPGSFIAVLGYTVFIVIGIWILIRIPFFRHFPNIVSYLITKRK